MARTDVFLTHDWGKDEKDRDNHQRVSIINKELQKRGYITWFDSDRLVGDLPKQMSEGIENTNVVIVFLTKRYVQKVTGSNAGDNCRLEFQYAAKKKTSSKIVPVVMESRMRNYELWTGKIGLHLIDKMYIDMSGDLQDEVYLKQQLDALEREITAAGVQKQEKEDVYKMSVCGASQGSLFRNKASIEPEDKESHLDHGIYELKDDTKFKDMHSEDTKNSDITKLNYKNNDCTVPVQKNESNNTEVQENEKFLNGNNGSKPTEEVQKIDCNVVEMEKENLNEKQVGQDLNRSDATKLKENSTKINNLKIEILSIDTCRIEWTGDSNTKYRVEKRIYYGRMGALLLLGPLPEWEIVKTIDSNTSFVAQMDGPWRYEFKVINYLDENDVAINQVEGKDKYYELSDMSFRGLHKFVKKKEYEEFLKILHAFPEKLDLKDGSNSQTLYHVIDNPRVLDEMLKIKPGNVDMQDDNCETALHRNAASNNTECLEVLIKYKANVDMTGFLDRTPLHYAAAFGHKDSMRLLLHEGANAMLKDIKGNSPLHVAAKGGKTECVRLLLSYQIAVDCMNIRQRTPLHKSAKHGKTACVRELLYHHANVHSKDEFGNTPLHFASIFGHGVCVEILLDAKADTEYRNNDGNSPLINAALHSRDECMKILLQHRRENGKDNSCYGKILLEAVKYENGEIAKLLINEEVDVNTKDIDGNTPLHYASMNGYIYGIRLLLENKADKQATNANNEKPLDVANKSNKNEIRKLLKTKKSFLDKLLQTL